MINNDNRVYDQMMRAGQSHTVPTPASVESGAIIPPALYLPLHISPEGQQFADVRDLPDGRRALIAFTALDRLAASCGTEQPWQLVMLDGLADIKDAQPYDVVAFDPNFADNLKRDGRLI